MREKKQRTICFPATFRGHLARQKLLLDELRKDFAIDIFEPRMSKEDGMSAYSIACAVEFDNYLQDKQYDCILIRGDRYEMLPLTMVAAYKEFKIVHIEGGDLSGAIDNKVRHAITQLSDYHFCTNEESHQRLIRNGVPTDRVWNFGSLDVEFAMSILKEKSTKSPYTFVAYHPIEGEDEEQMTEALKDYNVVSVVSNSDYGRVYGEETYTPEEYINLMRNARCIVGNSSSLLKEASILGTPVVLVGDRQHKRLLPKNVLQVPCEKETIKRAIEFQSGRYFKPDTTYYQSNTSRKIATKLKEVLIGNENQ